MKKILTSLLLTLACVCAAAADSVDFTLSSPRLVGAGEVFRIEFTINAKPDSFNPPAMEGLNVIAGPTQSSGRSMTIINGNMTQTVSYSFTYVLQASSAGIITIPAAEATVDGKTYRTSPTKIEVSDAEPAQGGLQTQQQSPAQQQSQAASGTVAEDDILVRITADRSSAYKGQAVRVAVKLYSRTGLSGLDSAKFPSFDGFWTQDLNTDSYEWQRETYNNKLYDSRVIKECLLYPQQSGKLTIEPAELTAVAQVIVQSRSRSIFDDFFGSLAPDIQEVRRQIRSNSLTIDVKDLPQNAPSSFNGAVGQFEMSASIPEGEISANQAITYTLKISGTGNLPLIQAPKLDLPVSFEQYNVKATESLQSGSNGIIGYRQFEYPMIARAAGSYSIPAAEFTYFDPESARYVTLSAEAAEMTVLDDGSGTAQGTQGLVNGISKEDIKFLGQDIRFIKIDSPQVRRHHRSFMGSGLYLLLLLAEAVLGIMAYRYLRRVLADRKDSVLMKGRMANKVALQRLRKAHEHMESNNQRGFYEEMLRALWGYMSDKLNIPVSNLTRENVREELLKRGVAQQDSDRYISIISDCEYAQYSPTAEGGMLDTYREAADLISQFESQIKRRRS